MIKEYAIDPEVAGNFQNLRLISALFDYSNPRRISRFPKTWERLVCEVADTHGDMNKTRVVEKLAQFKGTKKCLQGFGRSYDSTQTWINNALASNTIKAYAGIISDATGSGFINTTDIDDANVKLQALPSRRLSKTLVNFQSIFNDILMTAKSIHIIDPYFSPYEPKCLPLFSDWFRILNSRSDLTSFQFKICTSSGRLGGPYSAGEEIRFYNEVKSRFSPSGIKFNFSVKLIPHSNDMHDRYFLTDIASFTVGHSFSIDPAVKTNFIMINKSDGDAVSLQYS